MEGGGGGGGWKIWKMFLGIWSSTAVAVLRMNYSCDVFGCCWLGLESDLNSLRLVNLTEVDNLQGLYPLKDEWIISCSLKTRLVDQVNTQQQKWIWSKDSMNSTINQRLVEQTQEMDFKLEGSGGSTLDDTLRKQYLSSSDE